VEGVRESSRTSAARLAEKPDLTLHELLAELADEREIVVACDTLWRFLRREGVSFKKPFTPASRIDLTSRGGGLGGEDCRRASILHASSSLMKPGLRPT